MRRGKLGHHNGSFYSGLNGAGEGNTGLGAVLKHSRVLLERMPIGCLVYDADFKAIYANPAAEAIFGYSHEELIGSPPELLVAHEDTPRLDYVIERMLQGDRELNSVNRNLRKDGLLITCAWVNTALFDEGSRYIGMMCLVRDISGNVKLVEDLREVASKYETLVNTMGEGLVIADREGRYTFANPAMARIYGGPVDLILGRRPEDFAAPDYQQKIDEELDRRRKGQSGAYRADIIDAQGQRKTVEVSGNPRYDQRGNFDGLVAIIRDVTEQIAGERALRESEEKYRGLFEAHPQALLIVDPDSTTILGANQAAERLYSCSKTELVGRALRGLRPPEDLEDFERRWEVIRNTGVFSGNTVHQRLDGSVFHTEINLGRIELDGRPVYLLQISDVSDRFEAERIRKQSEEQYRLLFEHSPQPMWVVDEEKMVLLAVNDAVLEMYGYEREEMIGISLLQLRPQSDHAEFLALWESIREMPIWSGTLQHLHRDGSILTVEIRSNLVMFEGRRARMTQLNDITHQRRIQRHAMATEQLAASVIEHSPVGISVRDADGNLVMWNQAWINMWQVTPEGLQLNRALGQERFLKMIGGFYGEQTENVLDIWRKGGTLLLPEIELDHERASVEWISQFFYAITDEDGRVERVVTLTEDITEARRSQQQLKFVEQLNQAIVDRSPLGICVRGADGRLLQYNEAWRRIRALSDADIAEHQSRSTERNEAIIREYYGEDKAPHVLRIYREGGSLFLPDLKIHEPGPGGARYISQYFYSLTDAEGRVQRVVILTQDVTAAHEAAERLNQEQERLRLVSEAATDAFYEWDIQAGVTWRSESYYRLFGTARPAEADSAVWFKERVHPDDLAVIDRHSTGVMATGGAYSKVEYRFRHADGEYRVIQDTGLIVYDQQGRPLKMVGAISDITEARRQAAEKEAAEGLSRSVIQNSPIGITVRSSEGRLLLYNETWREIWGVEDSELDEHQHLDAAGTEQMLRATFGEEDAVRVLSLFHAPGSIMVDNVRWARGGRSEDVRWLSVHFYSIADSQGQVIRVVSLTVDNTEAAMAGQQLGESERQLRQIIDLVPHFIFAKDAEGRFLLVNEAVAEAYGTTPESLVGKSDADFNPNAEEVQHFRQDDLAVLSGGVPRSIEQEVITDSDGHQRILHTIKIPFAHGASGTPAVLGVSTDITERVRMEQALREGEQRVLEAQAVAHVGSWELLDRLGENHWSPELFRIFGLEPGTPLGPGQVLELFHPEDRESYLELRRSLLQPGGSINGRFRIVRPDGEVRWVSIIGSTKQERDGGLRSIGTCQDITGQMAAEEARRESEERYRKLVELFPDGVSIMQDGNLVFANEAVVRMLGARDLSQLQGSDIGGTIVEAARHEFEQRWQDLLEGRPVLPAEHEVRRLDGQPIQIEATSALISYDSQPAMLTVTRDITERKRAEASLRLRDDALEAIAYAAPHFTQGDLDDDKTRGLLARLGQAARVSRVHLLQRQLNRFGRIELRSLNAWYDLGYYPTSEEGASALAYLDVDIASLEELCHRGQPAMGRRSECSGEVASRMDASGARSFLIVPLFIGEEWWGYIGVEDCAAERFWATAEIDVFKLAANLLGSAMARTRAQELLQQSEERYRSLVNVAPDGVYVAAGGVFRFANPTLLHMLGLENEAELLGRRVADFVHPDYHALSRQRRLQLESQGGSLPVIEEVFLRADGTSFTVEVASTNISYENQPAAIVVLRDVTERKQAQRLLRLRDDILRAIAYSAPQFLIGEEWDEQLERMLEGLGRAAGVSRAFVYSKIAGRTGEGLAELRAEWTNEGIRAWAERPEVASFTVRGSYYENSITWLEAGAHVQKNAIDANGMPEECMQMLGSLSLLLVPVFAGREFWGFIGFDETQVMRVWSEAEIDALRLASSMIGASISRQRANERLRLSEERYRSLVDVSPDGIIVVRAGEILFANSTMARIVGARDSEQLVGRALGDFVHPDYRDLMAERFRLQQQQLGNLPGLDERYLRLDGGTVDVEVASALIGTEEDPQYIVVVRDISDRKQAQSSLRMRDAILEAIATVAPRLLAREADSVAFHELFERVGRAANVCRIYSMQASFSEGGRPQLQSAHEWAAVGVLGVLDHPAMQELYLDEEPFRELAAMMRAGDTVQGITSSFGPELREHLEQLGVMSMILSPVFVGNQWWGVIGFEDTRREREWSYAEVDALKLTSSLIGAALLREHAQAELAESEERFRMVNSATSDALFDWDIQRGYVWRSESYYKFFDLVEPGEEDSEAWWDDHIHPEDREEAATSLLEALADGSDRWSYEYRFRRGDGSYAEVADRGIIVRDSAGRAVRMIGAISDVTERRSGERRLKESEERYRLLAENSSDMISKNTPEGIFTYVSDSCYDLLGYRKEELLGTSTYDYFHPDDLEQVARSHSAVLRGQSVQSVTYRFCRKDGSYVWFETLTRPALDEPSTGAVELIATSRDVTERRQAELALRDSEQRYRTLYNNTPVMLHSTDREGRIISVSDYWLSVMGYTRGEVLGRNALDFISDESREESERFREQFMRTGYVQDVELRFVKRNGEFIDVLMSAIAEMNQDGSMQRGLAVMADITDRKRAQRQLQATVEQLKSIYDFSQVCGQSGSLEELLTSAIEALRSTLRPSQAGIMLPASDGLPRFVAWQGLSLPFRSYLESSLPDLDCHQNCEALLLSDVDAVAASQLRVDELRNEGLRALAIVPLLHNNRALGWCLLGFGRQHEFATDELQITETICSQLASAVERRRSEIELRESESGLARSQELAHLGSWQWNIESGQTSWSDELYRIVGLEPGSMIPRGLSILEFVHPEDQDPVHEILQRVIDSGEPASLDFRILRGEEEVVYVHAGCFPELSPAGNTLRIGGTVQDITQRVQAEDALLQAMDMAEQSRMRARAILDAAPEAIIMIDEQGLIDTYSEGAERVFGYSAEEVIGRPVTLLMKGEDAVAHREALEKAVSQGRSRLVNQSREVVGIHKNNSQLELELTIRDTLLGGRRMFVGVMRDISERRRMQTQLRQSQKMEAIGTLAGGIAHDFNNILQSILGYTGLARDSMELGHEAEEYLSVVMKAGLRARDLVQQILAFSRQSELQLNVVDLSVIVRESTKLMRAALPSTISIKTEVRDREVSVLGDAVQLHQVLMNLCTNAGYAMREKGGTLTVGLRRVFWDAEFARFYPDLHPGMHAELTVSDTGCGMSKEVLERVFEPFYTTKPVGEGTGMGLSVVHGIIHSLGGAVHISSEEDRGTTFKVYLPLVEASARVEEAPSNTAPPGTERILLVDDEEAIADMVTIMLTRLGYRVTPFTDARQALEELKKDPRAFDLLITDQTMPFMTGAVLSAQALKLRADLPIIVCTGYSEMFTPEQAQEMGVQAYLFKPVGLLDLAQTIRSTLSRSRPQHDTAPRPAE